ncbi:hypothetical protein BRC90_06805 [Halobacteriales archaeon QS_4_69_34]|nr:MAG: hypothetical protein BRC90_06805 [Halobacteriales archaeon QS_4_69_34]
MSRHSNRSHDVVGWNVAVKHRDGGVRWVGELDDADLADAVRNERLEVSVRATHADPDAIPTDENGVHVAGAEHVGAIQHVALVPRGAAAGATAAAGTPTEPIGPTTPGATTEPAAVTTATAMSDSAGSADAPEPAARAARRERAGDDM